MTCFPFDHLELSDYETAALEEAKKLDIRAMKTTIVEGDMNDTLTKDTPIMNGM